MSEQPTQTPPTLAAETVLVFPGQGAQQVGMAGSFMAHPASRDLFTEANDVLGFNLAALLADGPADELNLTANTQPALLLAGIAALKVLEVESGATVPELARFVAGHSLGEYTALVAAGALSFADGIRLVRQRGLAMQEAVPAGQGGMAAVLGLDTQQLIQICQQAGCFVANDNAPGQIVISGAAAAVEKAGEMARAHGAKRVLPLTVSAPFHCPLMEPAAMVMAQALRAVTWQTPVVPIISNVTAQSEHDPLRLRQLLVEQVTAPVEWRASMDWLAGQGITRLIELGCGNVLTGLARRCQPSMQGLALTSVDDIQGKLQGAA